MVRIFETPSQAPMKTFTQTNASKHNTRLVRICLNDTTELTKSLKHHAQNTEFQILYLYFDENR